MTDIAEASFSGPQDLRAQLDHLIQRLLSRLGRILAGAMGVGVAMGMGTTGILVVMAALVVLQQSVRRGLGIEMSLGDMLDSARGLLDRATGYHERALGYRDRLMALRGRVKA